MLFCKVKCTSTPDALHENSYLQFLLFLVNMLQDIIFIALLSFIFVKIVFKFFTNIKEILKIGFDIYNCKDLALSYFSYLCNIVKITKG